MLINSIVADGMKMIYKQLTKILSDMGLEVIETEGKEFDPNLHNAVMHVEDEELGENIIAEELQKAGYQVYTFSRRGGENKGNIRNLAVDVTNEEAVKSAVHEILEEAGKVDLVVNCAGFGISGAIEFTSI